MIDGLQNKLPEVLAHFGIFGEIGNIYEGPLVAQIEFKLAEGAKFATVEKLIKDIARELGVSGIRATTMPNLLLQLMPYRFALVSTCAVNRL